MTTSNVIEPVRALGAYTLKATEARIKLNQNESPFDLPVELKRRVLERVAARPWNRYPDFYPGDVLEGIGRLHGLRAQNVMIGNGSNELIQAIFAATIARGQNVAFPIPTFTLYAMMVAANEGEGRAISLTADLDYDLDAWRREADRGEAHLLLCTPNNPTGSVVDDVFVAELAERTERLVIVDEAYGQFGDHDLSSLVGEHDNVIVLRTFSKAMGLAGVRLGYALAAEELTREISKVKLPYNVGVFGLEVARAALESPDLFVGAAGPLVAERERLQGALADLPFEEVYAGMANFVLVRTPWASRLFEYLFRRGILIRDVGHYPLLDGCLRISVGTPEENDELLDTVRAFFEEES